MGHFFLFISHPCQQCFFSRFQGNISNQFSGTNEHYSIWRKHDHCSHIIITLSDSTLSDNKRFSHCKQSGPYNAFLAPSELLLVHYYFMKLIKRQIWLFSSFLVKSSILNRLLWVHSTHLAIVLTTKGKQKHWNI